MYICVCKAISDKQIDKAVQHGASSLRDLKAQLEVGTCCGKCMPEARRALDKALSKHEDRRPLRLADLLAAA
jgi:bacterioferritin-associated ferredoxin